MLKIGPVVGRESKAVRELRAPAAKWQAKAEWASWEKSWPERVLLKQSLCIYQAVGAVQEVQKAEEWLEEAAFFLYE